MKIKNKEPSIRELMIESLKNSSKPLTRREILSYVTKRKDVFSIKPHTFVSSLSLLQKAGKIKKVYENTTELWITTV